MHLDTKKKRESKSLELGWKFARWREEQNFYFGQERDCSGLFLHLFFFSPPPLRTKSWSWPATPSWLALEWNSRPIAATSRFSFFLPPLPLYIYIYIVYTVWYVLLFLFFTFVSLWTCDSFFPFFHPLSLLSLASLWPIPAAFLAEWIANGDETRKETGGTGRAEEKNPTSGFRSKFYRPRTTFVRT